MLPVAEENFDFVNRFCDPLRPAAGVRCLPILSRFFIALLTRSDCRVTADKQQDVDIPSLKIDHSDQIPHPPPNAQVQGKSKNLSAKLPKFEIDLILELLILPSLFHV